VVSERDRVGPCREDPVGEPWRDPDAVREVLPVDDAKTGVDLGAERG
jgi:hypothetical protein